MFNLVLCPDTICALNSYINIIFFILFDPKVLADVEQVASKFKLLVG
jgi:hypothetical protein